MVKRNKDNNNNNNRTGELIKELDENLVHWAENTTNHGIPKIIREKNPCIKAMWIAFFLASIVACVYVTTTSLIEYYKYKTTISIHQYEDEITPLPALTLCNMNPFNINHVGKYFKNNPVGFSYYDDCIKSSKNWKLCFKTNETDVLNFYLRAFRSAIANDKSMRYNRTRYGFNLKDHMLVSCLYNLNSCTADNFTQFWSHIFGNCYTFGDGKRRPVVENKGTGSFLGLILEMVVAPYTIETSHDFKTGILLTVHNHTTIPFSPVTQNYGIHIPTGYETYIAITRKITQRLGYPYSDCLKDLTPFSSDSEKIFGYFRDLNMLHYNQEFCLELCYQDKLIDKCGCCDITTPPIRNSTYCASVANLTCLLKYFASFRGLPESNQCKKICPSDCYKIDYEIEKSVIRFPSANYLKFLQSNNKTSYRFPKDQKKLPAYAKKSFLKLMVNYKDVRYTVIEENPQMTYTTLLGNFGGLLGLFIGISVLSLMEILELLIKSLMIYSKYRKNRNIQVA